MDWIAFLSVLLWSVGSAAAIVALYSLGIRLLTVAGRTPIVTPAEFTDAITVVTPEEVRREEKRAAKAARKSPLTETQKTIAHMGAWVCFVLSGAVVIFGIYLIVPIFHR